MKKIKFLLFIAILIVSCNKKIDNGLVLASRIQYDVFIKSPDTDLDWWEQNIEGEKREIYVKNILEIALSGNVKVYDYSNNLFKANELKEHLYRADSLTFQREVPPYDNYDNVITKNILLEDIVKLRFLEEWYYNNKNLQIYKKVVGICPMAAAYDEQGELKGYKPLFWLYFDEKYPINKISN